MKSKMRLSLLAGLLAVTVAVSGCAKGGLGAGGAKVATVDGTVITKSEYDKTYKEFERALNLDKMEDPSQKQMMEETIKQMTLNKLIMTTLIRNESKKLGLAVTDADVEKYKETEIFKTPELKEQFKKFLSENKLTEGEFNEMLKDTILLNKFIEKKGGASVAVSDAEVKEFYEKNRDQFKIPERIKARHILVKAIDKQMKDEMKAKDGKLTDAEVAKRVDEEKNKLREEAEKYYNEIKGDMTRFPALAKAHSDDTMSAVQGGDLGYMTEANIDPVFWEAVDKTKPGMLYPGVLATQFGYHIIQVEAHDQPHTQNFEEAAPLIRDHLSQQKKNAFLTQWAQQQKDSTKVVIEPAYQPAQQPGMPAGPGGMPMGGGMAPQGGAPAPQQPAAPQGAHQ